MTPAPDQPGPGAVAAALGVLRAGGLVAFPTETVYGLGADALDADAVRAVFDAKGRPPSNPLIVHVAGVAMARTVVAGWPPEAGTLAGRFWPGPLTLVLPRGDAVPGVVTAGGPTVGVRAPAHPLTLSLIAAFGRPLVGPSANPSGAVSPTRPEHVRRAFGDRVHVLDGGPCARGLESTVLDLAADKPRVLRPGVIGADAIAACLGREVPAAPGQRPAGPERAPGRLGPHYRPRAPVVVIEGGGEAPADALPVRLPADGAAAAACLYAELHEADAAGPARIAVILPRSPQGDPAVWAAVRERLGRAAGG